MHDALVELRDLINEKLAEGKNLGTCKNVLNGIVKTLVKYNNENMGKNHAPGYSHLFGMEMVDGKMATDVVFELLNEVLKDHTMRCVRQTDINTKGQMAAESNLKEEEYSCAVALNLAVKKLVKYTNENMGGRHNLSESRFSNIPYVDDKLGIDALGMLIDEVLKDHTIYRVTLYEMISVIDKVAAKHS